MIERAAQDSRIVPGDVIATGTVGGGSISEAVRKGFPARWLKLGDVVEIDVQGDRHASQHAWPGGPPQPAPALYSAVAAAAA